MAVLEAQVGHTSMHMVRWYTHVSGRAQHEAVSRIEAGSPELLRALEVGPPEVIVMKDPRPQSPGDVFDREDSWRKPQLSV